MIINANTKIAGILKANERALDAIISINPKFEKLRNPFLRRIMAARTSLAMASKFAGCTIEDFFIKLEPLGYTVDREAKANKEKQEPVPGFIRDLRKDQIILFDVRPILSSGSDPLNLILEKIQAIEPGQVLKITNSFEPTPLIILLQKKGFETYAEHIQPDLVDTYFFKKVRKNFKVENAPLPSNDWDEVVKKFNDKLIEIDVRHLEMPLPMHAILEALEVLPIGSALYIYHKRIPVFLLPELAEGGFDYRIKEISEGEVHLLVFKNE